MVRGSEFFMLVLDLRTPHLPAFTGEEFQDFQVLLVDLGGASTLCLLDRHLYYDEHVFNTYL